MKKGNERRFVDFDPAMYAAVKDKMPVKVFYTEDEIAKMKDQHFENSAKLAFAEEEKKQMVARKNEEIKLIKNEIVQTRKLRKDEMQENVIRLAN
ncbi:hypothetical protein J6W78_03800 [bacterium]|nr:hypothetical protein [bacterium]